MRPVALMYLRKCEREVNVTFWEKPKYDGLGKVLRALEDLKKVAKMIEEKESKKEKNYESI